MVARIREAEPGKGRLERDGRAGAQFTGGPNALHCSLHMVCGKSYVYFTTIKEFTKNRACFPALMRYN